MGISDVCDWAINLNAIITVLTASRDGLFPPFPISPSQQSC